MSGDKIISEVEKHLLFFKHVGLSNGVNFRRFIYLYVGWVRIIGNLLELCPYLCRSMFLSFSSTLKNILCHVFYYFLCLSININDIFIDYTE